MARVTVEDCVTEIPNRFELVVIASQRARNISAGAEITLERDNDKNPVVSLREIAEKKIDIPELEESLIKSLQKVIEHDEPDEEEMDMFSIPQSEVTINVASASEIIDEEVDDAAASDEAGDVMPVMEIG